MPRSVAFAAVLLAAIAACDQAGTGQNPAPSPSPSATASARVSPSATSRASGRPIELQAVVPEDGAKAGLGGIGWTVDLIAKGTAPALDRVKPSIRGGGTTGRHPNFPGLVVLIRVTSGTQSANPSATTNVAGLFQIIGLPNALGPTAGISSNSTNPSHAPAATGATGATGASASPSPAGTAAVISTSSTNAQTVEATWFVDQPLWGSDVDVELTAFVVDGDAPEVVTDRASLKIVSNEVTVRFHINGGASASPRATR